jgi:hypothetical protein
MGARRLGLRGFLVVSMLLAVSVASADTIATFADPSPNGATPLFTRIGDTLTGGWTGTGLTLITPITGGNYPNATFTVTDLNILDPTGTLSAGQIRFNDNGGNLVLQIDFDGGRLFQPFGWGGSVFTSNNVTFSGPIITNPLSEQQFAFSFANQTVIPGGFSWTAAFTSSAVPEPSGLLLLVLGSIVSRFRR